MVQAAAADSRHEHTELFQRAASQSERRDRNVHRVERPCEQMTSSYQPDSWMLLHNSRLVNGYGLFALRLFILGHSQVFHYNQVLTCPGPCFKTARFWDQCPSHTQAPTISWFLFWKISCCQPASTSLAQFSTSCVADHALNNIQRLAPELHRVLHNFVHQLQH